MSDQQSTRRRLPLAAEQHGAERAAQQCQAVVLEAPEAIQDLRAALAEHRVEREAQAAQLVAELAGRVGAARKSYLEARVHTGEHDGGDCQLGAALSLLAETLDRDDPVVRAVAGQLVTPQACRTAGAPL